MSDPHEITGQPSGRPRSDDITPAPLRAAGRYEPDRFAVRPLPNNRKWLLVGLGGLLVCLAAVGVGLAILAVAKMREAEARAQSQNNLMQMGIAMNNIASNSPAQAYIPPASGKFPSASENDDSFFFHLLPYMEGQGLYRGFARQSNLPVKTYCVHADRRNPGTDSTISYASNATFLGVNPPTPPRLPQWNGRASGLIIVMERSGLDGAHRWDNNKNSWLGQQNSPPPLPQFGAAPSAYQDGSPQAFTSAGCMVLLGDGTVRPIESKIAPAVWNSLCDPSASAPPDW